MRAENRNSNMILTSYSQ